MKNTIRILAMLLSLVSASSVVAGASMELEEACLGDVDLVEYISQAADSDDLITTDYLTEGEVKQLKNLLANERLADLTKQEKVSEVLRACIEGRIFQERHDYILNK